MYAIRDDKTQKKAVCVGAHETTTSQVLGLGIWWPSSRDMVGRSQSKAECTYEGEVCAEARCGVWAFLAMYVDLRLGSCFGRWQLSTAMLGMIEEDGAITAKFLVCDLFVCNDLWERRVKSPTPGCVKPKNLAKCLDEKSSKLEATQGKIRALKSKRRNTKHIFKQRRLGKKKLSSLLSVCLKPQVASNPNHHN
ncbi:hypothetical protein Ancab_036105 [Ancistrocladus abbreviatus]